MAGTAGRSGRRPKPTARKELAGNPGKRALNKEEPVFTPIKGVAAPEWFFEDDGLNDNVTLRVNGREWGGWTSIRIGSGIERLARDFSVEITRQWPGGDGVASLQPRVKNGDKVEVLIGDDLVVTGWVEATPVRYDSRSISVGISGRSLTADLIDCAAEPTQFNGQLTCPGWFMIPLQHVFTIKL